jgi:F0F1-type ATP synthase membrane subunit a
MPPSKASPCPTSGAPLLPLPRMELPPTPSSSSSFSFAYGVFTFLQVFFMGLSAKKAAHFTDPVGHSMGSSQEQALSRVCVLRILS